MQGLTGYLLLSRFDQDVELHIVDLVDLRTFETVHQWAPKSEDIFAETKFRDVEYLHPMDNAHFRIIHPLVLDDGQLLVKAHYSPLALVDVCSRMVWTNEYIFHHAIETDEQGSIWMPGVDETSTLNSKSDTFQNDTIVELSDAGEILSVHSVSAFLKQSGYQYLLSGMNRLGVDDPLHLNDVQPVLEDGRFWEKGDLFISLRSKSTVLQFRPSSGEFIWLKTGPWLLQHDVDILSDGKIAVFNNGFNERAFVKDPEVTNQILVYDFATDEVSQIFGSAFRENDIRTPTEGLFEILPSGHLLVEEENIGRILILDAAGQVAAEYINSASNGSVYRLGWSRNISIEQGAAILAAAQKAGCQK